MLNVARIPRLQDKINLAIGAGLFLSPWALQFTDISAAAWNAWICGLVIMGIAAAALLALRQWEQWHGIVLSLWIVGAPWALDFAPLVAPLTIHVLLGLLLLACEAWEIWAVRHPAVTA